MDIIAHRGFWLEPAEKNTLKAFKRAFESGFGVETDFRDCMGQLVISHDVPLDFDDSVAEFLDAYALHPVQSPIAINIKSDGLQNLIADLVNDGSFKNYFTFDMTVPDMRGYFAKNLPVFSRYSDQESPAFFDQSAGIWFDSFCSEVLEIEKIREYLDAGKKIAFVSSELHGRPHHEFWNFILGCELDRLEGISLCTDFPEEAQKFFCL